MSQAMIAAGREELAGKGGPSPAQQRVIFPSRAGRRLVGTLHEGSRRAPAEEAGRLAVVLCHGMESTRQGAKHLALASRFAADGFDCLRFDFGFVGESEGDFADLTISGEVEDALGALEFMAGRGARALALVGSSLGGTVAVLAAAKFPAVCALATIAAVSRPGQMVARLGEAELEEWRRQGVRDFGGKALKSSFLLDAERTDVLGAAASLARPVLIAHGERDQVVPPDDARALAAAVGERALVEIYPGADHRFSDPAQLEALLSRIAGWAEERLKEEASRR